MRHTQVQAAEVLGVSQAAVSDWERGTRVRPGTESIEALAQYLNLRVTEVARLVDQRASADMLRMRVDALEAEMKANSEALAALTERITEVTRTLKREH